jgi:hypothetical protein
VPENLELRIPVVAEAITWLAIVANVKLALRHPRNTGPSAQFAAEFAERMMTKLQQEGVLSEDEVAASLRDDFRHLNQPPRIVRDLHWVRDDGVLGEALGVNDETIARVEALVNRAAATGAHMSLRNVIDEANQTLNLSDAEWTTFMYTLGWWDHARRRSL